MKKYIVSYHRDKDGVLIATVKGLKGCHSYGRSLREARTNILDALSLWVNRDIKSDQLDEDWSLIVPKPVARMIEEARAIQKQAERLPIIRKEIAEELVASGLSVRDAGWMMGVTHQRVHQLVPKKSSKSSRRPRR